MGKIFITGGSGGGTSSDELTVTSENVLEGESYVGSDTDDEIGTGTMKDYSGVEQTATASLDSTNSQLEMTIPNTGKYSALSKLSATFATIANLIGIDTSKMLNTLTLLGKTGTIGSQAAKTWYATTGDQTVIAAGTYASGTQKLSKLSHTNLSAGNVATGVTVKVNNGHADVYSVTGTYKGKGTATEAQVLTGYTFSSASLSGASGTMANKTGWTHTFTPMTSQQSQTVPAGYHNGGYKVYCNAIPSTYVNISSGATVFNNGSFSYGYGWGAEIGFYAGNKFYTKTGSTSTASTFCTASSYEVNMLNMSMNLTSINKIIVTWTCSSAYWDTETSGGNTLPAYMLLILISISDSSSRTYSQVGMSRSSAAKVGAGDSVTFTADVSSYSGMYFIGFKSYSSGSYDDHPDLRGTINTIKVSS